MFTRNLFALPILSLVITVVAHADCAAPASPGLKICFPSEGSVVMFVPGIQMAATTASGAIARVKVWDNGTKRDDLPSLPARLYDGSMHNGWNRVVVKAWDTDGNLYQAQRSFYVTGFGVSKCSTPDVAGINLCWPQPGSWQPNTATPISATAKGNNAAIKYVNIYVDGKFLVGQSGSSIVTGAGLSAGSHRVTARAVDRAGHVFKASTTFNTFYSHDCNPRTDECSPGIVVNKPAGEDVPTTFTIQADVQNNSDPISAMKIYIDDVAKGGSSGPGITLSVTLPVNSTHRMTVKAWDTSGKVYESFQNLYVQ